MDMSSELIGIISVGVALIGLGWRVTTSMRKENKEAHDAIGDNITSVETRLNDRVGRMENRIDSRIGRLETTLREDNAETRKRIDRLFDQRRP